MNDLILKIYWKSQTFETSKLINIIEYLDKKLGKILFKLDMSDPLQKKVSNILGEFKKYEKIFQNGTSITLHGNFVNSKIRMSFYISRRKEANLNSLDIIIPKSNSGYELTYIEVEKLFNFLSGKLEAFYSRCDLRDYVIKKKRADNFSVNFDCELTGVFWLTFFCSKYVNYFGRKKFSQIEHSIVDSFGGITLKLGRTPEEVRVKRETAEIFLGKKSFVDPGSLEKKPKGEYALMFKDL